MSTRIQVAAIDPEAGANLVAAVSALGYEVTGLATTWNATLAALRDLRPDLVMLDTGITPDTSEATRILASLDLPMLPIFAAGSPEPAPSSGTDELFSPLAFPCSAAELRIAIEVARRSHAIVRRAASKGKIRQDQEKHLWEILHHIPDPAWLKDSSGRYQIVNQAFLEIHGLRDAEVKGRTDRDIMPAALVEPFAREDGQVLSSGGTLRVEHQTTDASGCPRWFEMIKSPVRRADGSVSGIVGIGRDTTRRHQTEAALKEQAETYRALLAATRDGVVEFDDQGRICAANDAFCRLSGYTQQDLAGRPLAALEVVSEAAATARTLRPLLAEGGGRFETQYRTKDGRHLDVEVGITHLRSRRRFLAFVTEITVRKLAERELRVSNESFRAVWEQSIDGMRITDAEGRILAVNAAYCRLVAMPRAELEGQLFTTVYTGHAQSTAEERQLHYRQRFARREVPDRQERQIRFHDGRVIDLDITNVFLDLGHTSTALLGIFRDITHRKQTETALRQSETALQNAQRVAHVGSWSWDIPRNQVRWSDEMVRIFGFDPKTFDGNLTEIITRAIHPEDRAKVEASNRAVIHDGQPTPLEYRVILADGSIRVVWAESGELQRDATGQPLMLTGIVHDITARKRLEAERERLIEELDRKHAELEQLVYVTSHDLRSPMLNIQGFASRIEEASVQLQRLTEPESLSAADRAAIQKLVTQRIPHSIDYVNKSVEKMDRLIEALLRLSRLGRAEIQFETLNVDAIVTGILDTMAYPLQEAGAAVVVGPLPSCHGDSGQINQLFSNLIDNAIKYRHPNRPLRLEVSGSAEGSRATYSIVDNGIGISPAQQEKIWEIFFRADPKSRAPGDGIGLNLARRIVERHQGGIRVESVSGEGSRFIVTLPAAPAGGPPLPP